MNNDLMNNIAPKRVISPVSVSDTTAQVGQVIDGQGYGSVTYVIATGSIADAEATFTVLLEESDASGSGFAAVLRRADASLIATLPDTGASWVDLWSHDEDGALMWHVEGHGGDATNLD